MMIISASEITLLDIWARQANSLKKHSMPWVHRKILQLLGGFFGNALLTDRCCLLLTSVELVHWTCLEESLLTCVEWVTCRTCFHTNLRILCRTLGFECVTTWTDNFYSLKLWVNIFLHKRIGLGINCNRSSQSIGKVRMLLLFFWNRRKRKPIFLNQHGGPGGIRTPEVVDKGFTVLPIWPLWNRPILN